MATPRDQAERIRFAEELDRNFSVIAAAGSGKTRAVTDRIVQLALSRDAENALPRLVVLTFANRAADEMQQRARQQIIAAKLPANVLAAFNRAWFGTIHAFCLKLLSDYGHHLGLPAPLELVTDDEDLWNEFVQQQTSVGHSLSSINRAALLRLAPVRQIMELGRCAGSALLRPGETCRCPDVDFAEVYTAADGVRRSETVDNTIAQLSAWEQDYRAGTGFLRWPLCSTTAGGIDKIWTRAFAPLRRWVNDTALCVAAEVQRDYRNFRLERGVVTYGDQIALADELLQHPEAARRLRQLEHIIILDEAQDTDPAQFSVLLETVRPPEATGRFLDTAEFPPRPGSFCMVGDFQQSIYHERADLEQYRRVHDSLVEAPAGAALTFSVTFRLDQRQLDFVNATFASILHGSDGQVPFVELQPRPHVLPGQVIRLELPGSLRGESKLKDRETARIEADELARWLQEHGPARLRARSWREVAVLCPRRDWLRTMAVALRKIGLPVEVQSESDLRAHSPAFAWVTALCTIMTEPTNSYEIVGVLREIYGLSDDALAAFARGDGAAFQIEEPRVDTGDVPSRLRELLAIREAAQELPLFSAVELLVQQTALRARIAALPPEDFNDPLADLDTLLTLAAEAETNGATLASFAESLRSEMERPRPVRISTQNAIQLITAQKAKGSEWDAVIVPFLSRRIIDASPRYPSVIRVPGSGEVIAALQKEDREEEIKAAFKKLRRQESERLLYVALTRARHTLVLALDRELFVPSNGPASDNSQLRFLRGDVGEDCAEDLAALGDCAEECPETSAGWSAAEVSAAAPEPDLPALTKSELADAKTRASAFVRKHNPSGLDEPAEAPPDALAAGRRAVSRSLADTPATLYGSWWHTLFEHFPWRADPPRWHAAFAALQPASPDPERSAREWSLLIDAALRSSAITEFLARPGVVVHTEFPFLWRVNEHHCVEGVIDLLVVDPDGRECLVVDWKTNRITAAEAQRLLDQYRAQLSAYWKAVTDITGFTVAAALYSTAAGKLLMYSDTELATEWTRLSKLSATDLHTTIQPPDFH